MDSLKNLADKIKEEQSKKNDVQVKDVPVLKTSSHIDSIEKKTFDTNEIKSNEFHNSIKIKKTSKEEDGLVAKIKASSNPAIIKEDYIHIRVDTTTKRKLKRLNEVGITTQLLISFLLQEFLKKEEVKKLIITIGQDELE